MKQYFPNDHAEYYKIMHGQKSHSKRKTDQTDFNVTEHKEFIDIVSDSILQVTLNKLPFVGLWYSVKEDYPQLSEKAIELFIPSPTLYLYRDEFLYTHKLKQHNATD